MATWMLPHSVSIILRKGCGRLTFSHSDWWTYSWYNLLFRSIVMAAKSTTCTVKKLRGYMKNMNHVTDHLHAYIIPSEDAHGVRLKIRKKSCYIHPTEMDSEKAYYLSYLALGHSTDLCIIIIIIIKVYSCQYFFSFRVSTLLHVMLEEHLWVALMDLQVMCVLLHYFQY